MALFAKKKEDSVSDSPRVPESVTRDLIVVLTSDNQPLTPPSSNITVTANLVEARKLLPRAQALVAVSQNAEILSDLATHIAEARRADPSGWPLLIIAVRAQELAGLGSWMLKQAPTEHFSGVRLIVYESESALFAALPSRLEASTESSAIRVPTSTEVEGSPDKFLFTISPLSQAVMRRIRELAENNIWRIYLLGGPGSGKTSVAHYYYQCRLRVNPTVATISNFITVNLTAESTDDKSAMKSLLCGHVMGAFPGAQTREGALSFAGEGVCFLDESHGVSGVVMQILMEVLESEQFLPYGATKKRPLKCAVIFASNRSWDTLRKNIHFDEHARLGASVVEIPRLSRRPEDLIAVAATTLSKLGSRFSSWSQPTGFSDKAWQRIIDCEWEGNIRTLMRTIETAAVEWATSRHPESTIDIQHLERGIELWEPKAGIHDEPIYANN